MKLRTCLALLRLHENLLLKELLQDPVLRTAWEIEMELETDDDEDIEDGVRPRRFLWRSLRRGSTTDLGS